MKIGFIDYYLSEWHANNYPAWISAAAEKLGIDAELAYAWAEDDVSPVDGVTTDGWCRTYGTTRCASIEELCELSDCIFILAPSNPEKHLPYASRVLKYGKPTYIDKSFAPSVGEAERIYEIAEKYGTPMFSSSALRYAAELRDFVGVSSITTVGGGRSIEEYIVHQAEMVEKLLGIGSCGVRAERDGEAIVFTVSYPDGRSARMCYSPDAAFGLSSEKKDVAISSDFFPALIADILAFFRDSMPRVEKNDTLEVMRLREMAIAAEKTLSE